MAPVELSGSETVASGALRAPLLARVPLSDIPVREFTHYETGVSPLGENYDDYARAVHLACLERSARNLGIPFSPDIDLLCARCVYHTRMPGIYLEPDGRCNMCHSFDNALAAASADGRLDRELDRALDPSLTQDSEYDVIVALSGGKDSSATLSYVAQELGLRTAAVLADNRFIPKHVIENCRDMCARAGAEFVVLNFDFRPEVKRIMSGDTPDFVPCHLCSKRFKSLITEFAAERHCARVLMGRNTWATIEPELSGERVIAAPDGTQIHWYSLPFLLRWSYDDLWPRLEAIHWNTRNMDIPGNSTNCLVPGMVAERFENLIGIHPETALLANEVIVGFITRDTALEEMGAAG